MVITHHPPRRECSRRFLFLGFSGEFFCFLNRVKNTHRDIQGCFVGCVCLLVFFDHLPDGVKMKLLLGMTPFSDIGIFSDIHGECGYWAQLFQLSGMATCSRHLFAFPDLLPNPLQILVLQRHLFELRIKFNGFTQQTLGLQSSTINGRVAGQVVVEDPFIGELLQGM